MYLFFNLFESSAFLADDIVGGNFPIQRPIFSLNFQSLIPSKLTVKSPTDACDKISGKNLAYHLFSVITQNLLLSE